uniref:Ig-like domain-containing protein n=1 Tax=Bos mutus grunniens TaxID=30521 RepID=A0A8B9WWR4_BOSMU
MLWAPVLLLVFLALVTQVSSNMEGDRMSITRATGSSAVIPCDLPIQNKQYIHWYKFQEGTVPTPLYYDVYYSKVVLESGISPRKYHGYEDTDKMNTLVISNLQESDSGVYHCAVWEKHIGSALLYTALKFCLSLPKNSPDTQNRPTPASLPAVNANSLYSEQSEILSSLPIPQL